MNLNIAKLKKRIMTAKWFLQSFELIHSRASIKMSFSQNGEDLILWQIFSMLGIQQPFYLDIGAHHPKNMSNTMLFYFLGANGINVEPDPRLFTEFPQHRARDLNLNIGIGVEAGTFDFYRMRESSLNTFSLQEAQRLQDEEGIAIVDILNIPVKSINQLLSDANRPVDLLSLDTEGNDYTILKDLNFTKFRPATICVETLTFSTNSTGSKITKIDTLLKDQGYKLYADTHINSIYVESSLL